MLEKIKKLIKYFIYSGTWAPQPRSLILEIASDCNLNCTMCFAREEEKKGGINRLSINQFKYILNELPELKEIMILGRGESFINPDIYKMLEIGKEKSIKFSIITNGVLLTEENIKKIPDNVWQIIVSIDCPIADKYEKIRGGELNVVIENIKKLKKVKKDIYVLINVVVMEDGIEDLPKFADFAKDIGANGINLLHLIAYNETLDKKHGDNFKNLKQKIDELKASAKEKNIEIIGRPLLQKTTPCVAPWLTPKIFLNGDCYPCCTMGIIAPIRKEYYQGVAIDAPQYQYKMGNIFNDDFKKIWNGKDYRLLRGVIGKSRNSALLSPEEFNRKRLKTDLKKKFSYCEICSLRQNHF